MLFRQRICLASSKSTNFVYEPSNVALQSNNNCLTNVLYVKYFTFNVYFSTVYTFKGLNQIAPRYIQPWPCCAMSHDTWFRSHSTGHWCTSCTGCWLCGPVWAGPTSPSSCPTASCYTASPWWRSAGSASSRASAPSPRSSVSPLCPGR